METDKKNGQKFFDRTIIECADAVRPQINIIDARSILIKSGPSLHSGGVIFGNTNEIIISGDMVAIDTYCSELLQKYDSTFTPENRVKSQLSYAEILGLGITDLSQIELIEVNL